MLFSTGVEVNLGHMMISNGYANPSNDDYPRVRSPQSRSSSNDALSSSTSSAIQPLKPQSPTPLTSKNTLPYSENHTEAENSLIEEQLQHLKKSNNLYLNGNGHVNKISPVELTNHNSYNFS